MRSNETGSQILNKDETRRSMIKNDHVKGAQKDEVVNCQFYPKHNTLEQQQK